MMTHKLIPYKLMQMREEGAMHDEQTDVIPFLFCFLRCCFFFSKSVWSAEERGEQLKLSRSF